MPLTYETSFAYKALYNTSIYSELTALHDLTYHTPHVQYEHMIHSIVLHSTTKQEGVVMVNLSEGECPHWWGSIRTIYLLPTTCKKTIINAGNFTHYIAIMEQLSY